MRRETNGPMIESGAHESLPKNTPGLDLDVPQVQKVRDESRARFLSFLWREMRPVLYCVAFGISMGAVVLSGIERKIDQEKEKLLGAPDDSRKETPHQVPVSMPIQTAAFSVDVDSFVEEILLDCHMPDKRELFKIAMDPKSTDEEKVREIARQLLTADPKNREVVEKALRKFLKKWLEAETKKLSGS